MSIKNKAFSYEPNYSINSASQVETAEELKVFEGKMGKGVVNRWTYKPFRLLGRFLTPKPDITGVTIIDEKDVGRGMLIVQPKKQEIGGALFIIHGGGYVVGNYKDVLVYACETARELGVPVVSPGYALGPEEPFPAGLNEIHEAWHWLQKESNLLNIDPTKIVIGGISAGGGMAAAIVQRLHDEGGIQPSGQLLIYPMLDDRVATKKDLDKPPHKVWNNKNNRFGWTSYLGHEPGEDVKPYSSPGRRANLQGLPSTWIGVGTADLFLDENRDYAKRLEDSGVKVTYVEVDGAIHAFEGAETEMGVDFDKAKLDFLKNHIL